MSFYGGLQDTTQRLLTKYGQPVFIVRQSSDFNAVSGSTSITSAEEFETVGVALDYTSKESGEANQNEELIRKTDKKIIVSAKDLPDKPKLSDLVRVAGVTYTIQNIKESNPEGTPIRYEMQGRI